MCMLFLFPRWSPVPVRPCIGLCPPSVPGPVPVPSSPPSDLSCAGDPLTGLEAPVMESVDLHRPAGGAADLVSGSVSRFLRHQVAAAARSVGEVVHLIGWASI